MNMFTHECINCGRQTESIIRGCRNGCWHGFRLAVVAERKQQKTLFAGLDCEPGQLDLFDTDGEL